MVVAERIDLAGDQNAKAYEYTSQSGETYHAASIEEAISKCTFLADVSMKEAQILIEAYSTGVEIMAKRDNVDSIVSKDSEKTSTQSEPIKKSEKSVNRPEEALKQPSESAQSNLENNIDRSALAERVTGSDLIEQVVNVTTENPALGSSITPNTGNNAKLDSRNESYITSSLTLDRAILEEQMAAELDRQSEIITQSEATVTPRKTEKSSEANTNQPDIYLSTISKSDESVSKSKDVVIDRVNAVVTDQRESISEAVTVQKLTTTETFMDEASVEVEVDDEVEEDIKIVDQDTELLYSEPMEIDVENELSLSEINIDPDYAVQELLELEDWLPIEEPVMDAEQLIVLESVDQAEEQPSLTDTNSLSAIDAISSEPESGKEIVSKIDELLINSIESEVRNTISEKSEQHMHKIIEIISAIESEVEKIEEKTLDKLEMRSEEIYEELKPYIRELFSSFSLEITEEEVINYIRMIQEGALVQLKAKLEELDLEVSGTREAKRSLRWQTTLAAIPAFQLRQLGRIVLAYMNRAEIAV